MNGGHDLPAQPNVLRQNESKESSIMVAVRVRPFTVEENNKLVHDEEEQVLLSEGSLSNNAKRSTRNFQPRGIRKIIDVVDDRMLIFDPPETNPLVQMQRKAFPNAKPSSRIREHRFVFDKLFDMETTQADVYESTAKPLLDSILNGFNATVFAYGATGCGKTHTILGSPENPGLIFLTMQELYSKIESLSDTKHIDVNISFLEIYNETIRDLLQPQTDFKKLVLREDAKHKISVANLLSHKPKSVEEVMDLILLGNQNRTSSSTEANATSSRSHAVLQINVVQKNRTAELNQEHIFATLSIIDLAGSERAAATKNRGIRLNEGANINKSLLALGNCINALCDPRRRNHIPYRDSKLTRLLKFSLGGNCKTVMIVCVSPLSSHYDETLNTLKYANRAKEIKTKLVRNLQNLDRHIGSYLKMITEQKMEIDELRNREKKIVQSTVESQRLISQRCLHEILTVMDALSATLTRNHKDRWKRYFILTKRKLLMLQKADIETILSRVPAGVGSDPPVADYDKFVFVLKDFSKRVNESIESLEIEYSKPSECQVIFSETSTQLLKRLSQIEGWQEYNTIIFKSLVTSLQESYEKDIMLNSSVLFDHLVYEIQNANLLVHPFVNMLKVFTVDKSADNNYEQCNETSSIIREFTAFLERMLVGDYDEFLEKLATRFLHNKEFGNKSESSNNISGIPNESFSTSKAKFSKRAPNSPLKSSPPRGAKKVMKSNINRPCFLNPRFTKKVRWDVPNSTWESDISLDESQLTINKSDLEVDSPKVSNITDKSDELDIRFDPILDSPPTANVLKDDMNKSVMHDISKEKLKLTRSSLTSRKLTTSEIHNRPSKLPLLNKLASTKLTNSTDNPVQKDPNMHNSERGFAPFPLRNNVLGAPSRLGDRSQIDVSPSE